MGICRTGPVLYGVVRCIAVGYGGSCASVLLYCCAMTVANIGNETHLTSGYLEGAGIISIMVRHFPPLTISQRNALSVIR